MKFKIYLTTLLLCFATSGYATPASDLTSLLNGITSMKAQFTQTVYDNYNKPVQTSYGKMSLQRPGKFRWEVTKPIPQLIIANASKLWIYDPDLEQVTIRALKQAAGEAPALFLSHENVSIEKDYIVKPIQKKGSKSQWYSLVSKSPDSMFASVQMSFAGSKINEMDMQDHLGHMTRVQFSNIQTNISLPASQFTFKAKPGTDVIDETR